jgi:hypothetical protein
MYDKTILDRTFWISLEILKIRKVLRFPQSNPDNHTLSLWTFSEILSFLDPRTNPANKCRRLNANRDDNAFDSDDS